MNIMSMLGSNKYVMSAIGAMMRGENPKEFMMKLANTNPALQGMDFNNLEETARSICEQKNINMNELADQIKEFANSNITL